MSGNNFLSRLFWGGMEEEETRIYAAEEIGMSRSSRRGQPEEEHQLGGFTIERLPGDRSPHRTRDTCCHGYRGRRPRQVNSGTDTEAQFPDRARPEPPKRGSREDRRDRALPGGGDTEGPRGSRYHHR